MIKAIAFDLCRVLIKVREIELTSLEFNLSEKFDYQVDGKLFWDWAEELTGFDRKKLEKICWDLMNRLYELREPDIFLKLPKLKFAVATNHLSMIGKWLKEKGIYDYFYCHVISEEIKCQKPEPEFYKILVEKLKEKPEKILFVDDRIGNVEGAQKTGFKVLHYDGSRFLSEVVLENLE